MAVVHFIDLEEMITELEEENTVRIASMIIPVESIQKTPGVDTVSPMVLVRQINSQRDILSWAMTVGDSWLSHGGVGASKPDEEKAEQGFAAARNILNAIAERLKMDNFVVRPGIIDLGSASTYPGVWSMLGEKSNEEAEEDEEET